MTEARRCVVVGAGIIGCSIALRLAERGVRVCLVDAAPAPGTGTSSTSDAWVNASSKRPYGYFHFSVHALAAHRRLAVEMGAAPWLLPTGCLEWCADSGGRARMEAQVQELEDWHYGVRRLTPARVMRELEPDLLIPREVEEIAFYPDEALVYPTLYLAHMLRACRSLQVECHFGSPVRETLERSGRTVGVALDSGLQLKADVVVCCVGRWTSELLAPMGVDIPLVSPREFGSPSVGFLVSTSPIPADIRRRISAPGINLRPDGGGRL